MLSETVDLTVSQSELSEASQGLESAQAEIEALKRSLKECGDQREQISFDIAEMEANQGGLEADLANL